VPVKRRRPLYRHLLVPTDGSKVSARAERVAVAMARQFGSAITNLHVIAPFSPQAVSEFRGLGPDPLTREEYVKLAERRGKALLARARARARRAGVSVDSVLVTSDAPGDALVQAARERGCDLIVMGSNSRVGIERIFLGSVASEVLSGTRTPALICH